MKNKAGIWMAVLTLTAIVLGVILLAAPHREAQAVMINAQTGYTLMTTGTPGGDEFLIIIDKASTKVVMYKLNGNSLDLVAGTDFGKLFR